jgi:hypothetical protein
MLNPEVNSHYKKNKAKSKHNERLNMRLKEDELQELDKLASKRKLNRSEVIRKLILKASSSTRKHSAYKCHACKNKIDKSETYYCELKNIEKQDDLDGELEIEVLDSIPTLVLCQKCAKNQGKLKLFQENYGSGLITKESFR